METQSHKPIKHELLEQSLTYVLGGFGLVAALAWNEAIKGLFETLFPEKNAGLIAKFGYAAVVTIIVVLVSVKMRRLLKKDSG